MIKEEEKKGIPGGAKPREKPLQRGNRISRKLKLEYRLLNNGYYCLRFVFIFRWEKKYRLVVIHDNQVWTDKYYKSKSYTQKAFERMYKNRSWKKKIKPEWSSFYPPGTKFALKKISDAYENTPLNRPLFPKGTARKNRHVRDGQPVCGEVREFSGRPVAFRRGSEIFRGVREIFGKAREFFGVSRRFSERSVDFRRGSEIFRDVREIFGEAREFFGVSREFSGRSVNFRGGPSVCGMVREVSGRPVSFRRGPEIFGKVRQFSGRSVGFRRGPGIFGVVRQFSGRSVRVLVKNGIKNIPQE